MVWLHDDLVYITLFVGVPRQSDAVLWWQEAFVYYCVSRDANNAYHHANLAKNLNLAITRV